jgi:hypothetical protein
MSSPPTMKIVHMSFVCKTQRCCKGIRFSSLVALMQGKIVYLFVLVQLAKTELFAEFVS